jgi:hypothetical protein
MTVKAKKRKEKKRKEKKRNPHAHPHNVNKLAFNYTFEQTIHRALLYQRI